MKPLTRPISMETPLPEGTLELRRLRGEECLGRPFRYVADLNGIDEAVDFNELLGKPLNVCLDLVDGGARYFHGLVAACKQEGRRGRYAAYRVELRPWLWFLGKRKNCRIFQDVSVPELAMELFREHGFTDFEDKLGGRYPAREYCVQYRESDLDFIQRLFEEEGIYYTFTHTSEKHSLILLDSIDGHEPTENYEVIPYHPPSDSKVIEREHVYEWELTKTAQSGEVVLFGYDFEQPRMELEARVSQPAPHANSEQEVFDVEWGFREEGRGRHRARIEMERMVAEHELARGESDARGLQCGALFNLDEHPREDQNREFLVTELDFQLDAAAYESGVEAGEGEAWLCRFTALDAAVPYRPARVTPRGFVTGPQTAIVVGKDGEEISTDKYGRVKVQFRWDRIGTRNEDSSCWVRVASTWAGQGWGHIQIPRIGQEVIVDFIEGDPDQPIITGRVYNGDHMPPYQLPANMTQSGVKSRSSKQGSPSNFNEVRFEDKKGEEELYIQAERSHKQLTKGSRSERVGGSRSLSVGKNKSETIGEAKSIEVGTDHTETIGASKTLNVGADHTETIGAGMAITVGANLTEMVGGRCTETIASAMSTTVGTSKVETVGAASTETVGAAKTIQVGAAYALTVGAAMAITGGSSMAISSGADVAMTAAGSQAMTAGKNTAVSAGDSAKVESKKVTVVAKDELVLKCGSAQIIMKKNGDIMIKGKKINVKGSGDVTIKGSKIKEN